MSTSMLYHGFGVRGVKYLATDYSGSKITIHAEITRQNLQCPKCASCNLKFRGNYIRHFHMTPIGNKPCFLSLILHRIECKDCNHLYRPTLSFMQDSKRMTKAFIRFVVELLAFGTIKDVADFLGVGWDTVKRIHKQYLQKKYKKIDLKDVEYISIDEFSIKKGHNYMTVITDVKSGAIIHAVEGRKKNDIKPFFLKLKKRLLI